VREERKFESTLELMAQIRRDVGRAREYFDAHPVDQEPLILP
jgi:FAD synthase